MKRFLIAAIATLAIGQAQAVLIIEEPPGDRYYFSADDNVVGWITLPSDYVFGTQLSDSNIFWLHFESPDATVSPEIGFHVGMAEGAIALYPGTNQVMIKFNISGITGCEDDISALCGSQRYTFETKLNGDWSLVSFDSTTVNLSGRNAFWSVPEPGTLGLFGLGLVGLLWRRKQTA